MYVLQAASCILVRMQGQFAYCGQTCREQNKRENVDDHIVYYTQYHVSALKGLSLQHHGTVFQVIKRYDAVVALI